MDAQCSRWLSRRRSLLKLQGRQRLKDVHLTKHIPVLCPLGVQVTQLVTIVEWLIAVTSCPVVSVDQWMGINLDQLGSSLRLFIEMLRVFLLFYFNIFKFLWNMVRFVPSSSDSELVFWKKGTGWSVTSSRLSPFIALDMHNRLHITKELMLGSKSSLYIELSNHVRLFNFIPLNSYNRRWQPRRY